MPCFELHKAFISSGDRMDRRRNARAFFFEPAAVFLQRRMDANSRTDSRGLPNFLHEGRPGGPAIRLVNARGRRRFHFEFELLVARILEVGLHRRAVGQRHGRQRWVQLAEQIFLRTMLDAPGYGRLGQRRLVGLCRKPRALREGWGQFRAFRCRGQVFM